MGSRGNVRKVSLRNELATERWRFGRHRLRGSGLLARDIRRRRGPLSHWKERLPREALENENISGFGHLRHGIEFAALTSERNEIRINRQVMVPQIMAKGLKMPQPLPCLSIQANGAVRKQVVSLSPTAVKVR